MADLSPKHFREPLLLSLYEDSREVVPYREIIPVVSERMGIRKNACGNQKSRVSRWIEKSFSGLKRDGLVTNPKRGTWSLTEAGMEAARLTTPREEILDEYLQSLLASQTDCLGFFNARSKACKKCLIPDLCRKHRSVILLRLAEEIENPSWEVVTLKKPKKLLKPKGLQKLKGKKLQAAIIDFGYVLQESTGEIPCAYCGEILNEKESIVTIWGGIPTSARDGSTSSFPMTGSLHLTCFPEAYETHNHFNLEDSTRIENALFY